MTWRVDVDVIRGSGRELYSKHAPSLADVWEFVRWFAVLGDRFVITKERG